MKKRKTGLSIIILLLILSNIAGIFKLQVSAEEFSKIYTFVPAEKVKWLTAIPLITIISLVAVWLGKRWGIMLAIFVFAIVFFLDVYYKVWAHALLASAGFAALLFFCWQSRRFFSPAKNDLQSKK